MKLDYKLSRILVLCIALILILIGIAEGKFGLKIDPNVSSGLLIVAAVIFFMGRRPNNAAQSTTDETKKIEETQIEQNENLKDNEYDKTSKVDTDNSSNENPKEDINKE